MLTKLVVVKGYLNLLQLLTKSQLNEITTNKAYDSSQISCSMDRMFYNHIWFDLFDKNVFHVFFVEFKLTAV